MLLYNSFGGSIMEKIRMEDIVNYCKQYGFIYQGSELYGGLANTWDYGPLGSELKKNIKEASGGMFDMIEINARSDYETIIKEHPNLMKYLIIRDSDAHSLEIINKQKFSFELEDKSIESLFRFILELIFLIVITLPSSV